MTTRVCALLVALVGLGGCVADKLTFHCDATHSCGASGMCIEGACAFAATECASGFRFDDSADNGRGGMCAQTTTADDMSAGGDDLSPMTPPDMTATDMACSPAVAEDCFNGFDDDCNGMADCADPACQAIVECVPAGPSFHVGAEIAKGASCPSHYTTMTTPIMQGLNAPTTCTGCSNTPTLACTTSISELNATCPGGSVVVGPISVNQATCANNGGAGYNFTTTNVRVAAMTTSGTCPPTGTATKQGLTWTTENQFCETTQIGAGCTAGFVCVAKLTAPAKHCVMAAGTQTCPTNYSQEGTGAWFTGVDDTRACPNCPAVTPSNTPSCGTSFVKGYLNNACTGSADFYTPNMDSCGGSTPMNSFQVALQGTTAPVCPAPTVNVTGMASGTGAQTVCCE